MVDDKFFPKAPAIPAGATCEGCRWCSYPEPNLYPDRNLDDGAVPFACRRRSPVATGGMMSAATTIWPQVKASDFCGEWEQRVSA